MNSKGNSSATLLLYVDACPSGLFLLRFQKKESENAKFQVMGVEDQKIVVDEVIDKDDYKKNVCVQPSEYRVRMSVVDERRVVEGGLFCCSVRNVLPPLSREDYQSAFCGSCNL